MTSTIRTIDEKALKMVTGGEYEVCISKDFESMLEEFKRINPYIRKFEPVKNEAKF